MRTVYLDVSCLNRPFDDQRQGRIRAEAIAVAEVFRQVDAGLLRHVASEITQIEIAAIPDSERRRRVRALLPARSAMIPLSRAIFDRAVEIGGLGIKAADAVHIAAAEALSADVLLTCDDRLLRAARRGSARLNVSIENPAQWVLETP